MGKRPLKTLDEPPSEPPYLNSTASWLLGDAWFLFAEMVQRCGLPTAKFIFKKCIAIADEQESRARELAKVKDARRGRAPWQLPTADQIEKAEHHQICIWWARLRATDQRFSAREKLLIAELSERYVKIGGYPKGFNESQLPPIPKRRNEGDVVLVKMFDRRDPQSAYCIERKKRGGKLTVRDFAATLVPAHGASAEHILRKVKYQRCGN